VRSTVNQLVKAGFHVQLEFLRGGLRHAVELLGPDRCLIMRLDGFTRREPPCPRKSRRATEHQLKLSIELAERKRLQETLIGAARDAHAKQFGLAPVSRDTKPSSLRLLLCRCEHLLLRSLGATPKSVARVSVM